MFTLPGKKITFTISEQFKTLKGFYTTIRDNAPAKIFEGHRTGSAETNWVKIYNSHSNYILLKAYPDRISLPVYNMTSQLLDSVDDLPAVKKQGQ